MDRGRKPKVFAFLVLLLAGVLLAKSILAQEGSPQTALNVETGVALVPFTQNLLDQFNSAKVNLDTAWTLLAAFLVCSWVWDLPCWNQVSAGPRTP